MLLLCSEDQYVACFFLTHYSEIIQGLAESYDMSRSSLRSKYYFQRAGKDERDDLSRTPTSYDLLFWAHLIYESTKRMTPRAVALSEVSPLEKTVTSSDFRP